MTGRQNTSPAWNHFTKISQNEAECKHCGLTIVRKRSSTAQLHGHIAKHHPNIQLELDKIVKMKGVRVNVLQSKKSLIKIKESMISSQRSLVPRSAAVKANRELKTPRTKEKSQVLRKPERSNNISDLQILPRGLATDEHPINDPVNYQIPTFESSQSSSKTQGEDKGVANLDIKALEDSLMENLAKVVKAKDQEFSKIAAENEELKQSLEEAKTKMEYLQQKEKEVSNKHSELANLMVPLKEALVKSDKDLKASKSEVAMVVDKNKSLLKATGVLEAELEVIKETNNNLQKEVGERDKMLEEIKYQNKEENGKLNEDKRSLEEMVIKVSKEREELKEELKVSTEKLKEANGANMDLEKKVTESQNKVEGLRNMIQLVEAENTELKNKEEEGKATVARLTNEIMVLGDKNNQLSTEGIDIRNQLEVFRMENQGLAESLRAETEKNFENQQVSKKIIEEKSAELEKLKAETQSKKRKRRHSCLEDHQYAKVGRLNVEESSISKELPTVTEEDQVTSSSSSENGSPSSSETPTENISMSGENDSVRTEKIDSASVSSTSASDQSSTTASPKPVPLLRLKNLETLLEKKVAEVGPSPRAGRSQTDQGKQEETKKWEFQIMKDVDKLKKDVALNVTSCLNKFYQNTTNKFKVIKSAQEFEKLARWLSHKYREEIMERHQLTHDSLEGVVLSKDDKLKIIDKIIFYFTLQDMVRGSLLAIYGAQLDERLVDHYVEQFHDQILETVHLYRGSLDEQEVKSKYGLIIHSYIRNTEASRNSAE